MRYLKFVLLSAAFAAIALIASAETVDAAEITIDPPTLHGMQPSVWVDIPVTAVLEPDDPQLSTVDYTYSNPGVGSAGSASVIDGKATFNVLFLFGNQSTNNCIANGGTVPLRITLLVPNSGESVASQTFHIPCSVLVPPNLDAIQQEAVCGSNNDVIQGLQNQPNNVTVQEGSWDNNERTVTLTADSAYSFTIGTLTQVITLDFTDSGPCETDPPIPPVQTEVCGVDNDEVDLSPNQPANVIVTSDGEWNDGSWNITFSAEENYKLPDGTVAEYNLTDTGPCETDPPIPPVHQAVCGIDNDLVNIPDQPTGVIVHNDGKWTNGSWSVTFSPDPDYFFPDGTVTEYTFTDSGPCETAPPIPPVHQAVCGIDNDLVTIPDQPDNVIVTSNGEWIDGEWNIILSAEEHYVLPDGAVTEYTFVDSGPCETAPPIPPVHTEVCGPDNDVVLLDTNQPENVLVESDGEWTEGTWNITFSAAEHYVLPDDAVSEYNLVDAAEPCPTDAPVPPVQTAICGPDNDLLTFPDQPEGVSLGGDTGWDDNERTVTFAISHEFVTDGPTNFTFTDKNDACPVIPVGKTVTVKLETSDGGSIQGAEYALYAAMASQAAQPAYDSGVVGADNMIVFEELMAGQYRLTVDAAGYEPVDELLTIGDGADAEEIVLQVTALQIPATPTPEPTTEPTAEPTAEPTGEPTAAPVSALPSTGAGTPGGSLLAGLALIVAAMTLTAVGSHRKQTA